MRKVLYILRGVPGCGKSTAAKAIAGLTGVVCCADDYFIYGGVYKFDASQLGAAHNACKTKCEDNMKVGTEEIIIANTNTTEKEFNTYKKMGIKYGYIAIFLVVENRHDGVNVHGVPEEALGRMEDKIKSSLKLR